MLLEEPRREMLCEMFALGLKLTNQGCLIRSEGKHRLQQFSRAHKKVVTTFEKALIISQTSGISEYFFQHQKKMFVLHEILRYHKKLVEGIPYSAFMKFGMQSLFRDNERIFFKIWIVEHMKRRIYV
jgi:hypothetical protein